MRRPVAIIDIPPDATRADLEALAEKLVDALAQTPVPE